MTPDTFPSLFWSYTVVWVILALYIIGLGVRVAKLERTISQSKDTTSDRHAAV
jgi:CcmD family protein